MYIPSGRLDAFYTTRISSTLQASISCITEPQANVTPGIDMNSTSGSALFRLQHDTGRWGTEYSWNSDGGILGLCVLRNFSRTTADNEEARRNQSSRAGVKRVDEEEAMEEAQGIKEGTRQTEEKVHMYRERREEPRPHVSGLQADLGYRRVHVRSMSGQLQETKRDLQQLQLQLDASRCERDQALALLGIRTARLRNAQLYLTRWTLFPMHMS